MTLRLSQIFYGDQNLSPQLMICILYNFVIQTLADNRIIIDKQEIGSEIKY